MPAPPKRPRQTPRRRGRNNPLDYGPARPRSSRPYRLRASPKMEYRVRRVMRVRRVERDRGRRTDRPGPRCRSTSRSRSGGQGEPGALDRGAVLDQAFDAAERGRALPQLDPRRRRDRRRLAAAHADARACRRTRRSSAAARSRGRDAGQPRIQHLRDGRVPVRRSGKLHRRCTRRLHAQMQASACRGSAGRPPAGPRICPSMERLRRMRSQNASVRDVASAPAITSECPFKYLVAACMTMSAPCSKRPREHRRRGGRIDRQHRARRCARSQPPRRCR